MDLHFPETRLSNLYLILCMYVFDFSDFHFGNINIEMFSPIL